MRVAPSPLDVRWRLASLGVRPISNVVDVTNLVMLEFGHPMHAFDLDRVRGAAIVVRRARAGERMTTLDGVERTLSDDDLVICDGEGPVALAGVMGGGESEIAATTQRVLLECAYFDPRGVRRAARRHGLHTEASHRFERGVDWGDTRVALARAASLIAHLAGATAVAPARRRRGPAARAEAPSRSAITGSTEMLGVDVEPAVAHAILGRLGFVRRASEASESDALATPIDHRTGGAFDVWEVPSFRPDVVARSRPHRRGRARARVRRDPGGRSRRPRRRATRGRARRSRAARATPASPSVSARPSRTRSFAPSDLEAVGAPASASSLRNPLGEENAVMRTSLLPGLLHAVSRARRHGEHDVRLFTVAPIFLPPPAGAVAPLPEERLGFAAVLAGERAAWLTQGRSPSTCGTPRASRARSSRA